MEMSRDQIMDVLLRHQTFLGLLPGDLRPLLEACRPQERQEGEPFYECDQPAQGAFFLLAGRVELQSQVASGLTRAHQIYAAGSLFGHEGLVHPWPRDNCAVASEPSAALYLSGAAFQKLLEAEDPAAFRVTDALMGYFVGAVRDTNQRFQDLHARPDRTLRLLRNLQG